MNERLVREANAETNTALTGERGPGFQEVGVRRGRFRIRELSERIGGTWLVQQAPVAVAESVRNSRAKPIGAQVVAVIERGLRLAVEHVEHVEKEMQLRRDDRNRVPEVQVSFVISRPATEGAARCQVVLIVAIAAGKTLCRERRARVIVRGQTKFEILRHSARNGVAAVELERMRAIVAQPAAAAVVDLEVRVVIRRVDVRVELTSRGLERAVVVAGQARPHVAGEELVVVAETLRRMQLNAFVLSRGPRSGNLLASLEVAGRAADALSRVSDEVFTGFRVDQHVFDDAAEIAIRPFDPYGEIRGELIVVA